MKRLLILTFALILSVLVYSQTILENPKIGMSTASNVKIEKIEICDTATVLWCHVVQSPGNWILIPNETYLQPLGSKDKLFIVSSEGIKLNEQFIMPASGEINYKLSFPKMDASVSKVDYGEANEGGSWFIYDIQLKPELFKSILPQQITGNWFRCDNAQWEISLFDSIAIYKSRVWKYGKYTEKEGLGKISLKNGSKVLSIYTKSINDSTCLIGENAAKMVKYAHHVDELQIPADKETYKLPIFKMDTVTYCGYIKGFSPRFPQRTGIVYVNDVLTGEQASYLIKIADDGSFKVKFPHTNPQGVLVRLPSFSETIFVEPGKTTFHLMDNNSKTNPVLFMGECARLNSDMLKLKHINSLDNYQLFDKVLDYTPEQYKLWIKELQQKDFDLFAYEVQTYSLCSKAAQIKKMEMDYQYASYLMEYGWKIESAWRKKNNIPQDQRTIPFKPVNPDSTYYNFLTNDLVNNPLGVLAPDYSTFINRLKYMEILRGTNKGYSTYEIMAEMEKAGITLTPEEKEMEAVMKEIDSPELKKMAEEFYLKYGQQLKEFNLKYADKLNVLYKEKQGLIVSPAMIEEYLVGKNIEFTTEEKSLLLAQKEYYENPQILRMTQIYSSKNKSINEFHNNHRDFVNELFQQSSARDRNENIEKVLGLKLGFATDIMASQDFIRSIVSEMTPVADQKLIAFQNTINTPFISNYIALKNNETKAKIEANNKMSGSKLNEVPKTEGDKVFDAIMARYKGKVVYVDFWATWCGPCRAGIEQIKPLKEEMANENVAFVYITNQTSPKTTYDNMIPTIKGEHYRVSADEWNVLCGTFKISGIPHSVLVAKDGKVINPHLSYMDNTQLKTLLMKHITE